MTWDAILFDFDETLAQTAPLKTLRDRAWSRRDDRLWRQYFDKIRLCDPVTATDGNAVAAELITLSDRGMPIAVVTSSPTPSVRAWFQHHYDWVPPVIVGYGDAKKPKPRPQPLLVALERLRVAASQTVLSVGDDARDVLAAHRAGIVSATFYRSVPLAAAADIYLPAVRCLHGAGTQDRDLPPTESSAALVTTHLREFDRTVVSKGDVLVGGRYVAGGGGLHDEILETKKGAWSSTLVEAACHLVQQAVGNSTNALLTTVPPRGNDSDRFQRLRSEASRSLDIAECGTTLRWAKDVGHLRNMGAGARRTAMANAFAADGVSGRRVVILDDVRTTGSTLDEAARAIRAAGGDPIIVALVQTLSTMIGLPVEQDAEYEYPMVGTSLYEALLAEEEQRRRHRDDERRRQEKEREEEADLRRQREAERKLQRTIDYERDKRTESRCTCGHRFSKHLWRLNCSVPQCQCGKWNKRRPEEGVTPAPLPGASATVQETAVPPESKRLTEPVAVDTAGRLETTRRRWTIEEIETLEAEWATESTLAEIAEDHGRTVNAIRHRLDHLGLIDSEGHRVISQRIPVNRMLPSGTAEDADSDADTSHQSWCPRPGSHRGDSWTVGEDEALADEWRKGTSVDLIAAHHHRTAGAITSRLRRLGLVDDR